MDRSAAATARAVAGDEQPSDVSVTPMIRQYLDAKARAGDAFLFFRLGDFYELFFEDAVRASELLGITLTARSKGADRVPMCGVPFHAARRYLAKLLEGGHKVAICEQVEAPGTGPGIVRREIVRVVTPGTVLDEDVLDASRAAWLVAVDAGESAHGAALLDVSTGDFRALQGASLQAVLEAVAAHEPREVLLRADAPAAIRMAVRQTLGALPVTEREPAHFDATRAGAFLRTHFGVATLEGFGVEGSPARGGGCRRGAPVPQGHPAHRGPARPRAPAPPARVHPGARRDHPGQPRGAPDAAGWLTGRFAARRGGPDRHRARRAPAGRVVARAAPRPRRHPRPPGRGRGAVDQGRLAGGLGGAPPTGGGRRADPRTARHRARDAAGPRRPRTEPRGAAGSGDGARGLPGRALDAAGRTAARLRPARHRAAARAGGHAAGDPGRRRVHPSGLLGGAGRARGSGHRWPEHAGAARATRASADRHLESQDSLHPGLRVLLRGHPRQPAPGAGQLGAAADDGRRRALRHPGAEGLRGPGARGGREADRPRAGALRRAPRPGAGAGRGAAGRRGCAGLHATR